MQSSHQVFDSCRYAELVEYKSSQGERSKALLRAVTGLLPPVPPGL